MLAMRDERFYIYFRMDQFHDVGHLAAAAIAGRERKRYQAEGPRRIETDEKTFKGLKTGDQITVKYAYYPNVFWGVSDDIRVPW